MRFYRPLFPAMQIYRSAVFRINPAEKVLLLTFDDGPDPASTEKFLRILKGYSVKALFFCCGAAARMYPQLTELILAQGHIIGNHGYHHLHGLKLSSEEFMKNAEKAENLTSAKYFRPPYGFMKYSQYLRASEKWKIIMWDLMSYDFDQTLEAHSSLKILKRKLRRGSILVFHDRPESLAHMYLGELIDFALAEGYRFELPSF